MCEVSGSHGGVGEGSTSLACYAVPNGKQSLTLNIKELRNVRMYLTLLLGTETQPTKTNLQVHIILYNISSVSLGLAQPRTQWVLAGLSLEAKTEEV